MPILKGGKIDIPVRIRAHPARRTGIFILTHVPYSQFFV